MDKLMEEVDKFRDKRNWRQFHSEKDLAISISLEAAELLELFQWNTSEETVENSIDDIEDELADVLIYSIMLASNLDLNIEDIILNKLEKNNQKYPVDKSRGSKKKYTDLKGE